MINPPKTGDGARFRQRERFASVVPGMPRHARFILPGVAVHVIQRGHNRNACFREGTDYLLYLMHLRELASKLECALHAYCLMTNHVHLLLTPPGQDSLARLMRALGQRYVQYFNRHHGRSGTLWEGRFRSCLTESPAYVLACHRYVEMNPVRAGMVSTPADYRWSSHRGNIDAAGDKALTAHPEYLALGIDADARCKAYGGLFATSDESMTEQIRRATNGGYPLVSDRLKDVLETEGKRLGPGRSGRPPGTLKSGF
jgi:putative transposase